MATPSQIRERLNSTQSNPANPACNGWRNTGKRSGTDRASLTFDIYNLDSPIRSAVVCWERVCSNSDARVQFVSKFLAGPPRICFVNSRPTGTHLGAWLVSCPCYNFKLPLNHCHEMPV